jgi:3-deoxy-D-manno-octulosonic-acid transferase
MRGLYNLGISLYGFVIHLAALFQDKAEKWVSGRKGYFNSLPSELKGCIWIHCASLGEFEQGRPVIEALGRQRSEKILLTFFSPSGYEIRKNYGEADAVLYLPLDTPKNARRFLDHFSPTAAIFIKYEVWHNYYRELRLREIPHYIVSAIFRKEQPYFKPYGSWFLKTLQGVSHIFCQDHASELLLRSNGVSEVSISGDTRFDRVKALASSETQVPIVESWLQNRKAIIAGSTWSEDEELLLGALDKLPEVS